MNKQKKAVEEEISYINSLLSKSLNDKASLLQQFNLLEKKIELRTKIVADSDIQLALLANQILFLNKNISLLNGELESLKAGYASFLVALYKKRKNDTWLMYVLASDDIAQAYRRLKYFRSFADFAEVHASQIKEKSLEIESSIVALDVKKKELSQYKKAKEQELASLAKDEEESKNLQKEILQREKTLKGSLVQKNKVLKAVNDQIEKLIAEEAKKVSQKQAVKGSNQEAIKALSTNFESNRGKLPWPVKGGVVVEDFGKHSHPVFKGVQLPPNNGIDISTEAGASVFSIFNGEVRQIFSLPGMGTCILLRHGEFFTLYCKFSSVAVNVGDTVSTGQKLGSLQVADKNSLLHFEVWKGTTKLNPELWLTSK